MSGIQSLSAGMAGLGGLAAAGPQRFRREYKAFPQA